MPKFFLAAYWCLRTLVGSTSLCSYSACPETNLSALSQLNFTACSLVDYYDRPVQCSACKLPKVSPACYSIVTREPPSLDSTTVKLADAAGARFQLIKDAETFTVLHRWFFVEGDYSSWAVGIMKEPQATTVPADSVSNAASVDTASTLSEEADEDADAKNFQETTDTLELRIGEQPVHYRNAWGHGILADSLDYGLWNCGHWSKLEPSKRSVDVLYTADQKGLLKADVWVSTTYVGYVVIKPSVLEGAWFPFFLDNHGLEEPTTYAFVAYPTLKPSEKIDIAALLQLH